MPLGSAFRRYIGVLGALLRLEEENRRHAPMDSIINLLEPIFLIVTLSFLFYILDRRQVSPLGGPTILFYSTGFFPLYFFIYVSRRMRIDAPRARFPIEQRLDHIIVHVILRIIDYAILGILLFGGVYLLYTAQAMPSDLVRVVEAFLAIAALGFGWGTLNLVLSKKTHMWSYVFPTISRALLMFSGVFFVPDFLLPSARDILSFNPLMHAVALFKSGFYPQYPAIILDVRYLAYCSIFAVFLGLVAERVTRRSER
jgi:capsular polysaccharide transport system permease protein